MSLAANLGESGQFALRLVAVFACCQLANYLGIQLFFFVVALGFGGLYLARRPAEATWVGFFLLALTSQLYPIQLDEVGTALSGAFQPYIAVIAILASSVFLGQQFKSGSCSRLVPHYGRVRASLVSLIAAMLLTLAYGYFTSKNLPGLFDILRACSGWMTLLVFLFIGYRLGSSSAESQRASSKLRLAVLAYSVFFIAKFMYLANSFGASATASWYGYSQRDMAFFVGVVLVTMIAEALTSNVRVDSKRAAYPAAVILVCVVLLTGSRSVFGCVLFVTLLFMFIWRSKTRLRFSLLVLAATLVFLFGPSWDFSAQQGLVGYVSNRFLVASSEDSSFLSRASEMQAVVEAVHEHPLVGRGPLASYLFFDPIVGWKETTFVDSGLGYLLMKSGLLGTCIFFWFAVEWLKMAKRLRRTFPISILPALVCFVFYLTFLPFGPSFFVFQYSWFVGFLAGQAILLGSTFPRRGTGLVSGGLSRSNAVA